MLFCRREFRIDLEEVLPVCEEYGMYYVRGSGTISDEMYEKVKQGFDIIWARRTDLDGRYARPSSL